MIIVFKKRSVNKDIKVYGPGMVMHTYNPSTQGVERGGSLS